MHFSIKEQFDEAEAATPNGLDQPEQPTLPLPQLPPEAPSSLEQEPDTHELHLQPQHEESVLPAQSTLTADDMRRAKRIRHFPYNVPIERMESIGTCLENSMDRSLAGYSSWGWQDQSLSSVRLFATP